MAKGKGGAPAPQKTTTDRKNGKASKKRPKMFDPIKRRLVTAKQRSLQALSSKKLRYTCLHQFGLLYGFRLAEI